MNRKNAFLIDRDRAVEHLSELATDGCGPDLHHAIECIEAERQVRHDPGDCIWKRTESRDGLVHYDTQCGECELFVEDATAMRAKYCLVCGGRIHVDGEG